MEQYFNSSPTSLDTTFFGTPMILTKPFDYCAEDNVKESLDNYARKKTSLCKDIRSYAITGVQLNNRAHGKKIETLLHKLMAVDSMVDKKIGKVKIAPYAGNYFMPLYWTKHQSWLLSIILVPILQKARVWLAECCFLLEIVLT